MTESAWAAGFFEGEGCVHFKRQRTGKGRWGVPSPGSLHVTISQSYHPYTLTRWADAMGLDPAAVRSKKGSHVKKDGTIAPIFRIDLSGLKAAAVMTQMLPYLSLACPKRARYLDWVARGGADFAYRKEDRKS